MRIVSIAAETTTNVTGSNITVRPVPQFILEQWIPNTAGQNT